MALQQTLPLFSPDVHIVSPRLAILVDDERLVAYSAADPIYSCALDDRDGMRLAAGMLSQMRLAPDTALAEALGVSREMVRRNRNLLVQGGVGAIHSDKRGPRTPYKLKKTARQRAQRCLDEGWSVNRTAREVGLTEGTLRYQIRQGRLRHPPKPKRGEAAPEFQAAEAVPGAGVLLALPALLDQGLVEVPQSLFGALRNGFFGLRSVLLTLAFMALLRIKSPEQLTGHAPGELGLLLGLDRVPEVKTLRRKLAEMGDRGLARILHQRLAEPLFVVTAEATEGLVTMIDQHLLPEIRQLAGPRRRVTIVFDRQGWSPESFSRWQDEGFDVITYRKAQQSRWQERFFTKVTRTVDGRKVVYRLAQRRVTLSNGLRVREVRRLTDDGHQTAVITTNQRLSMFQVAHRMFSRWRQENFFRYMRHEFAVDHLCTHAVEPADPKRAVPHPERKRLDQQIRTAHTSLGRLIGRRGHLMPGKTLRVDGRMLDEDEVDEVLRKRERDLQRLQTRRDVLPKEISLDHVLDAKDIVQLERERKLLTDAIKMIAYRAESYMARWVEPFFARHEDEARKFLQSIFQATADLLPDANQRTLTVRFHGLSTPRATRALSDLCEIFSVEQVCYPGTDLRLRFEAPECHTN